MTAEASATLLVSLRARPGCGARLRDELATLAAASRADPGCVRYDVLEDTEHPGRFALCEEWLDEESLVEHNSLQHVAWFLATSASLLEVPMQVQRLRRSA